MNTQPIGCERVAGRLAVDARRRRSRPPNTARPTSEPRNDNTGNQARVLSDLRTAHERLAISHEVWNATHATSIGHRRARVKSDAVGRVGTLAEVAATVAPGRVNLMGDHTDYNDGFVPPVAIDRECVVDAAPASGSPGDPARLGRARRRRSTVAADGGDDPRTSSRPGAASSPASVRVLDRPGRARSPPPSWTITLDGPGRARGCRRARRCRWRSPSRWPTSAGSPLDRRRRGAARARGRGRSDRRAGRADGPARRRCSAGPGMRCSSTAATCRGRPRSPIAAGDRGRRRALRACPARSSGSAYAARRAECEAVAAAARASPSLRDATLEQVARRSRARVTSSPRTRGCSTRRRRCRRGDLSRARPAAAREPRQPPRRLRGVDAGARPARRGPRGVRRGRRPAHRRRLRRMRRRARAARTTPTTCSPRRSLRYRRRDRARSRRASSRPAVDGARR